MKSLRTAIFGTGFMGRVHLEAVRRVESVEATAIAGRNVEAARRLGAGFSIPKIAIDYREILADLSIDAVHICTPNSQHFPMAKDALIAGKNVLCEKPLATSVEEGEELVSLAKEKRLRNCVCHNLRYYPMVQQMRSMCEAGDLGEILVVQGTYSQDWLLYDTDWNWRLEPEFGGNLRAVADIGSHWMDLTSHVAGQRIVSVMADLKTFIPVRRRPTGPVETFATETSGATVSKTITTEDCATILLRYESGAIGNLTISQISAGRKNTLEFEIDGSTSAAAWNSEHPDDLWIGHRGRPNELLPRDPALLNADGRAAASLPGGHNEGFADTFKALYRAIYRAVAGEGPAEPDYPTFADGHDSILVCEAVARSARDGTWARVAR